jgi:hypothetical protein
MSVPIRLFMCQQCGKFTKKYRITEIYKPERTFAFIIKDCIDFNPTLLRIYIFSRIFFGSYIRIRNNVKIQKL